MNSKILCATTKTSSTKYTYIYIHIYILKIYMGLANGMQSWDLYWENPWTDEEW